MATLWVGVMVLLLGNFQLLQWRTATTKKTHKQRRSQMSQQGHSAELKAPQGVLKKCEIKPGRGSSELVACHWEKQIYLKHDTCRASEWRQQCLSLIGLIVVDCTSAPTHFKTALWPLHLKVKDEDRRIRATEWQTISRKLTQQKKNADRIMESPRAKSPPSDLHSFAVFRNLTCSAEKLQCFLALGNQLQQDECLIRAQQLSTSSCGIPRWATLNFMPSATELDFGRFASLL